MSSLIALNGASLLIPVRVSWTSDWEPDRVSRLILPLAEPLKLLLRISGAINESSDFLLFGSVIAFFKFSVSVGLDSFSGSITG